jgi:hypothetical protein
LGVIAASLQLAPSMELYKLTLKRFVYL